MVAALRRRWPARVPAYDPRRALAFMHVPKTAGSSLIAALVAALQPSCVASGFDRVLFGGFADFASLDPALRAVIHRDAALLRQAPLLAGHMALSTLLQAAPDGQVMTVLREPSCRLLSHWLFWRGHSDERLAPWGAWGDRVRLARLSLAEFLAAPALACQHDNLAVRMLLWPHALIPEDGFIPRSADRRLLAEARRRLDRLAFTGVVEDPALAGNLARFFGRPVTIPRQNRTARLPAHLRGALHRHLTEDACARLLSLSRLDGVLWQAVAGRGGAGVVREAVVMRGVGRAAELMRAE